MALNIKEGDGTLNEIFRKIPITSFPKPPKGVITIPSTASIAEAAKILHDNNILAAPIRNVKVPDDGTWIEKYIGIVDLLAIVQFMAAQFEEGQVPKTWGEMLNLKSKFKETTVDALQDTCRWIPFVPVDEESNSTMDVMLILGKYAVHRVTAIKPMDDVSNVITQKAILKVLFDNLKSFSTLPDKTLAFLGLCDEVPDKKSSDVISVTLKNTYLEVFKIMNDQIISAVPVVDEEGALVGNVSTHDLRHVLRDPAKFVWLSKPLEKFEDFSLKKHTCKPTDTLGDVIKKLYENNVRRLYVVDEKNRPVKVVSLREVIALFVREDDDMSIGKCFVQ